MKVSLTYQNNQPNTVNGYSVTVNVTYSSFNKSEIDGIINELRDNYKSGLILEFNEEESD